MSEIEITLAQHSEQIKTLFKGIEENQKLTESVQKLALSVERLTLQMTQQDERIKQIEDSSKYKFRTLWSSVISAIAGAIVAFIVSQILGAQ